MCVEPKYNGDQCQGNNTEERQCNTHSCPVDGYWQDWATWDDCTAECGGGIKSRTRTCIPPMHNGTSCVGSDTEQEQCNTQQCPVDGVWLAWGLWSPCSVTCDSGTKTRKRTCKPPEYGGNTCEGADTATGACNEVTCEIPGDWLEWGTWSSCSATCTGGMRTRVRECDFTVHGSRTGPCIGANSTTGSCMNYPCDDYVRTCTEMKQRGLSHNALVQIDPDGNTAGVEPFYVWCDMKADGGVGITMIGHNAMNDTHVTNAEGASHCEFQVGLQYANVTLAQAISLVDISGQCSQYISWRCYASAIAVVHRDGTSTIFSYWFNRKAEIRHYWDGSDPTSDMCACGLNRTCADPENACNCNSNDEQWRQDDGHIRNKQDLPITSVCIGETGGGPGVEEGYLMIGLLKCSGEG
ncbi:contactin-associated protein-like 2 [Lineus longissimus]|uniref:contactin-associated protein-like 2 n=1 Tax=Lineus longissimus TaxID=88925 RepID=UPI002B4E0D77